MPLASLEKVILTKWLENQRAHPLPDIQRLFPTLVFNLASSLKYTTQKSINKRAFSQFSPISHIHAVPCYLARVLWIFSRPLSLSLSLSAAWNRRTAEPHFHARVFSLSLSLTLSLSLSPRYDDPSRYRGRSASSRTRETRFTTRRVEISLIERFQGAAIINAEEKPVVARRCFGRKAIPINSR